MTRLEPYNIVYLATNKSDKELSQMLVLIRLQQILAFEQRNEKALLDLQRRELEIVEARVRKMELN